MNYQSLKEFAEKILIKCGLEEEKAKITAEILLEGELLGHRTHGLQLLSAYVSELENNLMEKSGEPIILNDKGNTLALNGRYLPGTWLVEKAIETACKRVEEFGVVTITIAQSHHIACLAAFLEKVVRKGYLIIIAASDPKNKTVAPFGGTSPTFSPNPYAVGIPTETEPILIDISMSVTSNALVARSFRNNEKLPNEWLLDSAGVPTDDPSKFFEQPPATILPLGGMDSGYKGFGLGLLVEALTNAMGGYGRAESPDRWGCSVFIQVIDSQAFAGKNLFLRETEFFKNECLKSSVIDPNNPVRMPGERGLKMKKFQIENGVKLLDETLNSLKVLADKYEIEF